MTLKTFLKIDKMDLEAHRSLPRSIPKCHVRPFWNHNLDIRKKEKIKMHRIWKRFFLESETKGHCLIFKFHNL